MRNKTRPAPAPLLSRSSAALRTGRPLDALAWVAGCGGGEAEALRGLALAQAGDREAAARALRKAAAALDREGDSAAAARCRAALAELAAADRRFAEARALVEASARELLQIGDRANAAWTLLAGARASLLEGDARRAVEQAAQAKKISNGARRPLLNAVHALVGADAALRYARVRESDGRLAAAAAFAERSGIGALIAEVGRRRGALRRPCADLYHRGARTTVDAFGWERALHSGGAAADGLRLEWAAPPAAPLRFASRASRFRLLAALARRWPDAVTERELAAEMHGKETSTAAAAARVKTELARLRRDLRGAATISSEPGGLRIAAAGGREIRCLVPCAAGAAHPIEMLLSDGAAWPAASLAAALGKPLRTTQREIGVLLDARRIRSVGGSRALRYVRAADEPLFAPWMFLAGAGARGCDFRG